MPLTQCLSERAINAVITRLTAILTASDFETNAGQHIIRSARTIDAEKLPCLVIFEGNETPIVQSKNELPSGSSRSFKNQLSIHIEAHVAALQDDTGELIGKIKADVKRALMIYDTPALEDGVGKIGPIAYAGSEPLSREDGSQSESVRINFIVSYAEGYGDPYASK